jgi:hypothetical protein
MVTNINELMNVIKELIQFEKDCGLDTRGRGAVEAYDIVLNHLKKMESAQTAEIKQEMVTDTEYFIRWYESKTGWRKLQTKVNGKWVSIPSYYEE